MKCAVPSNETTLLPGVGGWFLGVGGGGPGTAKSSDKIQKEISAPNQRPAVLLAECGA